MSGSNWFWIIFVISIIFGGLGSWKGCPPNLARWSSLVPYILFFFLGWAVFGGPIK